MVGDSNCIAKLMEELALKNQRIVDQAQKIHQLKKQREETYIEWGKRYDEVKSILYDLISCNENSKIQISQLMHALKEVTPELPSKDAVCHAGITTQEDCKYCSRILNARKLLGYEDNISRTIL